MIDYARTLRPHEGEALACPLFQRLTHLGLPTLVVAEYDPTVWRDPASRQENRQISGAFLRCAAAAGLPTLDLFETIDQGVRQQVVQTVFRLAHPAPVETALAAWRIADELKERHMPPR